MRPANEQLLEDTEIRLLLDGLFHGFGYDFRDYVDGPLKRRVWERVHAEGVQTISQLQDKVFHQPGCLEALLISLSTVRASMFCDPGFYAAFRATVVPILRTYPSIQVWQPACSTGEEVYALAILLHEAGLFPRARIYATDVHKAMFTTAEQGLFPLSEMAMNASNYQQAGGSSVLSEYYTVEKEYAVMIPSLREHVVFTEHSLAVDEGFNEFQLILCRHTWDLYNPWLQDRVMTLFYRSLCRFGMLGVGRQRFPKLITDEKRYEDIGSGWYRKASKHTMASSPKDNQEEECR
jgi:chemotaxis protein methyltransferase CheR